MGHKRVISDVESLFGFWSGEAVEPKEVPKEEFDIDKYLKKGQKIISLKREVQERSDDVKHEKVFSKLKKENYSGMVEMLRKQWAKVLAEDDIDKVNDIETSRIFKEFSIKHIEDIDANGNDIIRRSSKSNYQYCYLVKIICFDDTSIEYYGSEKGCKKNYKNSTWYTRSAKGYIGTTVDIPELLAVIETYNIISEELETGKYDMSVFEQDMSKYYRLASEKKYEKYVEIPAFSNRGTAKEVLGDKSIDIYYANLYAYDLFRKNKLSFIPNEAALNYKNKSVLRFYNCDYVSVCDRLIKQMVRQCKINQRKRIYEKVQSKDYALSFMTKKNIPDKVVRAMQNSLFNDWFGFVEFDELTDLNVIKEIEKEFKAFQLFLFGEKGNVTNNIALRFRRLGHHKASGLYYPSVGCICIDIKWANSFVHEYGHMLDYTNGEKSDSIGFRVILDEYENILKKTVEEQNIELKGKYNLDYYLTPTEVFARTFEIYMKRVLKMDNSLLGDCEGFAYPDDEAFVGLISDYFTDFFISQYNVDFSKKGEQKKCASI